MPYPNTSRICALENNATSEGGMIRHSVRGQGAACIVRRTRWTRRRRQFQQRAGGLRGREASLVRPMAVFDRDIAPAVEGLTMAGRRDSSYACRRSSDGSGPANGAKGARVALVAGCGAMDGPVQ